MSRHSLWVSTFVSLRAAALCAFALLLAVPACLWAQGFEFEDDGVGSGYSAPGRGIGFEFRTLVSPGREAVDRAIWYPGEGTLYESYVGGHLVGRNWEPDSAKLLDSALVLLKQGRGQDALQRIDSALRIAPRSARAWRVKGHVLSRLGRYQEAVDCCDKALEIDPRDAIAWNNKGYALDGLRGYQEAVVCYDTALRIAPRDAIVWNNKGCALDCLRRHQDAVACYDAAIRIDPRDADVWHNKGAALYASGRYVEARQAFVRAKSLGCVAASAWLERMAREQH